MNVIACKFLSGLSKIQRCSDWGSGFWWDSRRCSTVQRFYWGFFFFSRLFGEFQDGRSIWIATGWSESIKFSWMWSNGNCNNSTRFFRDSRGIRTDSRGIDIHPPLMSYHNGINHTNGRIWPGASVPVAILFMCYEYNTVLNTTNQSINQSKSLIS